MSARPVLGEHVAVVGQGLIGLLTAAVMQRSCFNDADSPLITALVSRPYLFSTYFTFHEIISGHEPDSSGGFTLVFKYGF